MDEIEKEYTLSYHKNQFSIGADQIISQTGTFDQICDSIINNQLTYPVDYQGDPKHIKDLVPCISNTIYLPGADRRAPVFIDRYETLIFDVDNKLENPFQPEVAKQLLEERGYQALIYSTFSCTKERPKFRVIVFLEEPLKFTCDIEYKRFAEFILDHCGFSPYREQIDTQGHLLRDMALSKLPCSPNPENVWFIKIQGKPINYLQDDIEQFILPEETRLTIRTAKLRSKEEIFFIKHSLNHLDLSTLDLPRLYANLGWYCKKVKETTEETNYECYCPWADTHSDNTWKAGIIVKQGQPPGFHCFHTHPENGLVSIIKYFGLEKIEKVTQKKKYKYDGVI